MRRVLFLFIAAMLFSSATVFAQGGTTGPLTWELNDGTLTISGEGEMPDYLESDAPWQPYTNDIIAIVIVNGVTNIGSYAFKHCTFLTSISIDNSVVTIGNLAFTNCTSLPSIIIPNGTTTIGLGCFSVCTSLTSVTIPSSVITIEGGAFSDCTRLTTITNLNSVPIIINTSVFEGVNQSICTLEVPMGSVLAYQNADIWKEFNIVGIDVGVESINPAIVNIYPNPTTGEFRIASDGLRIENVIVYDIFGKIQKIENWQTGNRIDISHLSAGVYFVKVSTETGEVVRKVLKE